MNLYKVLIISKILVILIVFGIIFFIFNEIFMPFGGSFKAEYDFSEDSEYFSHLGPWQRLFPPAEDEYGYHQQIKDDLVYITFHLPQFFKYLDADITFQTPDQDELFFGPRVGEDEYKREKLEFIPVEGEENMYIASHHFNLRGVFTSNRDLKFVFAAPGLRDNQNTLKFYNISFEFTRPTIDVSQINPKIRNIFEKIYYKF